jgi:hypothetical protein
MELYRMLFAKLAAKCLVAVGFLAADAVVYMRG